MIPILSSDLAVSHHSQNQPKAAHNLMYNFLSAEPVVTVKNPFDWVD